MAMQQKKISFDDVSREFDQGVAGADTLRADSLGQLNSMRAVKDKRMKRERGRLAAKLGENHPRIAAIDNRLKLNAAMIRDLKLEAARARTQVPQVDNNTWALHGYVRDKAHQPASNLVVALFDSAGGQVSGADHGCTDSNGYYQIKKNTTGTASTDVFVRVLSKSRSLLYADNVPLTPAAGIIDYREIILSGDESVCVPPVEPSPPPTPFGPPQSGTGTATGTGTGGLTPTTGEGTGLPPAHPPKDFWVVRGRVTDRAGKAVSGVFVSVYDKDLFFDDRLGQAQTNQDGNYSLTYRTEDFRDLIEKRPDLYVKVIDQNGNTLRTVQNAIWYEAGRDETIDITIA